MADKASFRKHALSVRAHIAEREKKSEIIKKKIMSLHEYSEAQTVGLYISYKSEVETDGILNAVLADGKLVAVPRVEADNINFYFISSVEELEPGSFSIREPRAFAKEALWPHKSIILVPGCAFTRKCERMGYGGGYYDRYLARLKKNRVHVITIGLAFEDQINDEIPSSSWDVRLDAVVTEKGIYRHEN